MGSEGPSRSPVTVHVTGFKKFHGVSENPTERIVCNLKAYMEKAGLPQRLILGSCNVLETAGQGAVVLLYQILQSAIMGKVSESSNSGRIIWVSSFELSFVVFSYCLTHTSCLGFFVLCSTSLSRNL